MDEDESSGQEPAPKIDKGGVFKKTSFNLMLRNWFLYM
jgi:hypothetical protein